MTKDPGPEERARVRPLFVPVRKGPAGHVARIFRTPLGSRTAVAFTSERRLAATLGPAHAWIRLSWPALRALTEPLGITRLAVDPRLAAPAPPAVTRPGRTAEPPAAREEFVS